MENRDIKENRDINPTNKLVQLGASVPVNFSDGGEEPIPKFSMVAYTGAMVESWSFEYPLVIDLKGIDLSVQEVPIRLQHDIAQGVGHTTRLELTEKGLEAEGLISRENEYAEDVTTSSRRGFPWQASIGIWIQDVKNIPHGKNVQVNGRSFDGPLVVATQAELAEISFVEKGADGNTSATVSQFAKEGGKMEEDLKEKNAPIEEAELSKDPHLPKNVELEAGPKQIAELQQAQDEIRKLKIQMAGRGENVSLEKQAQELGWSPEKFELELLRSQRSSKAPAIHAESSASLGKDAFTAIALMAGGLLPQGSELEKKYSDQTLSLAYKRRGIGLQKFMELASGCDRSALPEASGDFEGWMAGVCGTTNLAFSTTSLPGILSDVFNRSLMEGYQSVVDPWRKIAKISSVRNFQEHKRYRLLDDMKYQEVAPGGTITHGKLGDQKLGIAAKTYAKMYSLERTMIIDDDLSALSTIPQRLGMGAQDAIIDAFYTNFLANGNSQEDSTAFWHANHANLKTTGSALSATAIGAAILALQLQKTPAPESRVLGLTPRYLLVPPALEITAGDILAPAVLAATSSVTTLASNSLTRYGLEIVSSAFLQDSRFTNYSAAAWYLLADAMRCPTIEVAFLNGKEAPTVESSAVVFDQFGIQYRGYLDFGIRMQDYRGSVKSTGAAAT